MALGAALLIEDSDTRVVREILADLALVPDGLYRRLRERGLRMVHVAARQGLRAQRNPSECERQAGVRLDQLDAELGACGMPRCP